MANNEAAPLFAQADAEIAALEANADAAFARNAQRRTIESSLGHQETFMRRVRQAAGAAMPTMPLPSNAALPTRMRLYAQAFRILIESAKAPDGAQAPVCNLVALLLHALAGAETEAAQEVYEALVTNRHLGANDAGARDFLARQGYRSLQCTTLVTAARMGTPRLLSWLLVGPDGAGLPNWRWSSDAYRPAFEAVLTTGLALPALFRPAGQLVVQGEGRRIDEVNDGTPACHIPPESTAFGLLLGYGDETSQIREEALTLGGVAGSASAHGSFGSALVPDLVGCGCNERVVWAIVRTLDKDASESESPSFGFDLVHAIRAHEAASYNARRHPEWCYGRLADNLFKYIVETRCVDLVAFWGSAPWRKRHTRLSWTNTDPDAQWIDRLLGAPLLRASAPRMVGGNGGGRSDPGVPAQLETLLGVLPLGWQELVPLMEEAHHHELFATVARVAVAMGDLDRDPSMLPKWLTDVNAKERSFLTRVVQAGDYPSLSHILALPWGQEPLVQALCMASVTNDAWAADRLLERITTPLPKHPPAHLKQDFGFGGDWEDDDDGPAPPPPAPAPHLLAYAAERSASLATKLLAHAPSWWRAADKRELLWTCLPLTAEEEGNGPHTALVEDLLLPPHALPIDCLDERPHSDAHASLLRTVAAALYAPPGGRGYRIGLASWHAAAHPAA